MEWQANTEIEIRDLGDRLEVLARTQQGFLAWVFFAIGVPAAIYFFMHASRLIGIAIVASTAFSIFKAIRNGGETCLTARTDGFIAEGNVDRALAHRVSISVDDIHSIGFFEGFEGETSGFYAFSRFGKTCLVPDVGNDHCEQIQSAIQSKFPQMQFGQEPLSYPFGGGPRIISLGLSSEVSPDGKKSAN